MNNNLKAPQENLFEDMSDKLDEIFEQFDSKNATQQIILSLEDYATRKSHS